MNPSSLSFFLVFGVWQNKQRNPTNPFVLLPFIFNMFKYHSIGLHDKLIIEQEHEPEFIPIEEKKWFLLLKKTLD